ncbi:guanylate kinase [Rivularia sp. UHCC 0363]|uniref:guanylate kinase n=1 Tax=Rivularia sp. UHCC 0363 TaxID=3110244 RepID=UPI002B21BF90|nr:guanylate kinase [Rivularia sp. UHCC 0363]MEA5598232.1 guanylate kinase [Rivularia sp. UHCC 0363]
MMQVLSTNSGATAKLLSPGKLIVLTGPSGVGKGTLMRLLLSRHPELNYSISATTRLPRPGEVDGKDYFFIDRTKFQRLIEEGEFLEWAEFASNLYGTPRKPVIDLLESGSSVLLEIELEGARQIRAKFPDILSIFILPPTFNELEKRIRGRKKDSEAAISRRLKRAKEEIDSACEFHIQVVNDDLETAVCDIEMAISDGGLF